MSYAWARAREDGRAKRGGNDRGVGLHRCGRILVFIVMEEVQGRYGDGIIWCSIEMCENVEMVLYFSWGIYWDVFSYRSLKERR